MARANQCTWQMLSKLISTSTVKKKKMAVWQAALQTPRLLKNVFEHHTYFFFFLGNQFAVGGGEMFLLVGNLSKACLF